jgi:hypothetical protein
MPFAAIFAAQAVHDALSSIPAGDWLVAGSVVGTGLGASWRVSQWKTRTDLRLQRIEDFLYHRDDHRDEP